jgi:hypothetical protein
VKQSKITSEPLQNSTLEAWMPFSPVLLRDFELRADEVLSLLFVMELSNVVRTANGIPEL